MIGYQFLYKLLFSKALNILDAIVNNSTSSNTIDVNYDKIKTSPFEIQSVLVSVSVSI